MYGLLHRSDSNYNEAIKAYKQALRIDQNNLQILRDLSMLQIQMRDLDGFVQTRNQLLAIKSNAKVNWIAFALARHMAGDLRGAVKVIDTYMGTLTEGSSELGRCFESSELALYRNMILAEIPGNYKEALEHLNVCEGVVVDRGAWLMKRAEYLLKLQNFDATRSVVLQMFDRGMTENHHVHSLYMCAVLQLENEICDEALQLKGTQTLASFLPLTEAQKQKLGEAYRDELAPYAEKSKAVQRIPFAVMNEDELRKALDGRCRTDLRRGVPSLGSELASYIWKERNGRLEHVLDPVEVKNHPRYTMLVDLVKGYLFSLESSLKFPDEDKEEDASTLAWTRYLRARLHEMAAEYTQGLELVEKCIEGDADAVDMYELKARLLKASGDMSSAVDCLDKGRELDKSDRYMNNQTAKYMLQDGQEGQAIKRISMFTKHEGNPEQNLYEMQCSWYELELAACLAKKKDFGRSLKKYSTSVSPHRTL